LVSWARITGPKFSHSSNQAASSLARSRAMNELVTEFSNSGPFTRDHPRCRPVPGQGQREPPREYSQSPGGVEHRRRGISQAREHERRPPLAACAPQSHARRGDDEADVQLVVALQVEVAGHLAVEGEAGGGEDGGAGLEPA